MDTILQVLTPPVVFIAGLIVRALVAILVLAAIVVPIAAVLMAGTWIAQAFDRATGLRKVGHVRWRRGCYYTPGHLWLRPQADGAVRIGVDDVAQRVLPEIAQVSLPMEGATLEPGEAIGSITCADSTVVLRSPVAGVIAAVNHRLLRAPSLLHRDPYRRAWIVEMRPKGQEYQELPSEERAREWIAREDQRLTEFLEHQLGVAAADGGELTVPPHRLLTASQWQTVREGFLKVS
jgi:glycine cleavage system H protein